MAPYQQVRTRPSSPNERAGVLVTVALLLPLLLMMASFVVDIGNWWEHKRHLQLQADAAVLAGGSQFQFPCTASIDSAIYAQALQYAGPASGNLTAPYNPQVGNVPATNLHITLNGGAAPGTAGAPCGTEWVDAVIREDDAPWFLKVANLVGLADPSISAHARAEIMQPSVGLGLVPIGYEESDPQHAAAILVDDASGATLAAQYLTKIGQSGSVVQWNNASAPFTRTIAAGDQLSAVIALSQTTFNLTGSVATICAQTGVVCFHDNGGSYTGLPYIRGYTTSGTGTFASPIVKNAFLTVGTCTPDPNFTTGACSPVLTVTIDTGATQPNKITVSGGGCGGNACTLTQTSPGGNTWSGNITSPTGGLGSFTLNGTCSGSTNGCNKGKVTFAATPVQRMYVGPDDPVELAQFIENGGTTDSMLAGQHTFYVNVGVLPALQLATSVNAPLVTLDIQGATSHTRALDCDPNIANFKSELISGCNVQYVPNTFTAPWYPCPTANSFGAQPWECVALQTASISPSQLSDGMATRTGNASGCVNPSNWSSYPNIPDGDPRVITIFRVPFGSFKGSGNQTMPITGFAAFYVTGWGGNGSNTDPCPNDDPAAAGVMVGHFMKYISKVDNAPATQPCDPNDPEACELVLVQ
jgi:hypothetical protein